MKYFFFPALCALVAVIVAFPISTAIAFVLPSLHPDLVAMTGLVLGGGAVFGALWWIASRPRPAYKEPPETAKPREVVVEACPRRRPVEMVGRTVHGDLSVERLCGDPKTAENIERLRVRLENKPMKT